MISCPLLSPIALPSIPAVVVLERENIMKRLTLLCAAALLVAGCASNRGGTGTDYNTTRGTGTSPAYETPPPVNDLDDLGAVRPSYDNQRANGQPRVPGHSIDINTGP